MTTFKIHTPRTAPDQSAEILDGVKANVGFIPNVFATIAESPSALNGIVSLGEAFSSSTFTSEEQQIIQLAASTENECAYCVSGHTAFSQSLEISDAVVSALRAKEPVPDVRLDVLSNIVRSLIQNRGHIAQSEIDTFIAAGYTRAQFLEVVLGISVKTFSNYVSIALNIPLDAQFEKYTWKRPTDVGDVAA
jgi:uncharacterized peroxidase-related enzyme